MLTLQSCINSLQEGGNEDIKKAKKEVRHIWRQLPASRLKRKKFVETYLQELQKFENIQYKRNQLAFISSLRYLFLEAGNEEEYFLACRDFVIKHIQNPSGHIRQAIVHASDWLILALNIGVVDTVKRNDSGARKRGLHKEWFCRFVETVDELLDKYEDKRTRRYKYIDNMPSGVYKSLQFLMYNLMRSEEHRDIYRDYRRQQKGENRKHEPVSPVVPEWMDCTWKRLPCGNTDCPICSQDEVMSGGGKLPQEHIESALEDILSDLHSHYADVQDYAAQQGVTGKKTHREKSAPSPEDFPLYNKLKIWRDDTLAVAELAADEGSFWPATDPGQDLLWYGNILLGKSYRQLCNRWYMDQGENCEPVDYEYTAHVLLECLTHIKVSLRSLIELDVEEKYKLNLIFLYLPAFEADVLGI